MGVTEFSGHGPTPRPPSPPSGLPGSSLSRRSVLSGWRRRGGDLVATTQRSRQAHRQGCIAGRRAVNPGVASCTRVDSGHCAVGGPARRLRCRLTAPAAPNRLLRKLLAVEGLPRAARHQAHNPPGLRPLGRAAAKANSSSSRRGIPPCSLRRGGRPGSNSRSSGSSDRRSDTRTPYGLLSLHYPNQRDCNASAATGRRVWAAGRPDRTIVDVGRGRRTSVGLGLSWVNVR